jgi:hypothetical protein
MAADRIFGLLERDFSVTAVDRAGRLSAHRTLLALSRDARRKVHLVSANFDRLFEAAAPNVPVWTPNRLPKPSFQSPVPIKGKPCSPMQDSDRARAQCSKREAVSSVIS